MEGLCCEDEGSLYCWSPSKAGMLIPSLWRGKGEAMPPCSAGILLPCCTTSSWPCLSLEAKRQRHESKPQEVLQNLLPQWQQQEATGKEKSWAGCWGVMAAGQKWNLWLQWALRGAESGQPHQLLQQQPGTSAVYGAPV